MTLGDEITPYQFNHIQPHQLRKKHALKAGIEARAVAGLPVMKLEGPRNSAFSDALSADEHRNLFEETLERIGNCPHDGTTKLSLTGPKDSR